MCIKFENSQHFSAINQNKLQLGNAMTYNDLNPFFDLSIEYLGNVACWLNYNNWKWAAEMAYYKYYNVHLIVRTILPYMKSAKMDYHN